MSEHAASEAIDLPKLEVPEIFMRRLEDKFRDKDSYKKYLSWCSSPETIENIRLLRDVFCRPVTGPITPEQSVWYLGFNSGAWSILDVLTAIRVPKPILAEPQMNYDVPSDEDVVAANERKDEHGKESED